LCFRAMNILLSRFFCGILPVAFPNPGRTMHDAFLLLGGNQGRVAENLAAAVIRMEKLAGEVFLLSGLYASEPWGMESDTVFLNQAMGLRTHLDPLRLMQAALDLEMEFGRVRKPGIIESRPIDIDILLFDQQVISVAGLEIPHPRMHLRRFALQPLAEIAPGLLHPVFGKSIAELLNECRDPLWVKSWSETNQKAS
jgi:2-amino-4-hydroxy-6-hydroxymethyldihydropteridine diphosphokinase